MPTVKRALISVYDKKGLLPFVRALHKMGIEVISTGGTAKLLKSKGIPVTSVSDITQFPEMLGGRVKTLHPKLHAGLLALRDKPEHLKTLKKHKIETIDLLVVNLYPFWEALHSDLPESETIEMIDIGGPALLRSAAKNYKSVAAVFDPRDYTSVAEELESSQGRLSEKTLRGLAGKVFKLTSYYDGLIGRFFDGKISPKDLFQERITLDFEKIQDLRYGENPHQKGALYVEKGGRGVGVVKSKKLHGKELSFNNILDLDIALEMVEAFEEPACAVIKHNSPCGFAVGKDIATAFKNAHRCDTLSAFGSIIGLNQSVDSKAAKAILESGFIECVIAENFTKEALQALRVKKNLRLLTAPIKERADAFEFKKISNGLLLQERDCYDVTARNLKTVTKLSPTPAQTKDLLFAFKVCRFVKSNAILVAKDGMTVGIGMGQPSRVDSCESALKKAGSRARGAVLASDGFFPMPDSILLAAKAGIRAIIQPGGSIKDEEVIKACDRAKIAMVCTGIRHFKH